MVWGKKALNQRSKKVNVKLSVPSTLQSSRLDFLCFLWRKPFVGYSQLHKLLKCIYCFIRFYIFKLSWLTPIGLSWDSDQSANGCFSVHSVWPYSHSDRFPADLARVRPGQTVYPIRGHDWIEEPALGGALLSHVSLVWLAVDLSNCNSYSPRRSSQRTVFFFVWPTHKTCRLLFSWLPQSHLQTSAPLFSVSSLNNDHHQRKINK